jgi:hypothetical protein
MQGFQGSVSSEATASSVEALPGALTRAGMLKRASQGEVRRERHPVAAPPRTLPKRAGGVLPERLARSHRDLRALCVRRAWIRNASGPLCSGTSPTRTPRTATRSRCAVLRPHAPMGLAVACAAAAGALHHPRRVRPPRQRAGARPPRAAPRRATTRPPPASGSRCAAARVSRGLPGAHFQTSRHYAQVILTLGPEQQAGGSLARRAAAQQPHANSRSRVRERPPRPPAPAPPRRPPAARPARRACRARSPPPSPFPAARPPRPGHRPAVRRPPLRRRPRLGGHRPRGRRRAHGVR